VASTSAQAYWTLDVGYYHLGIWPDYEWRPAGEAIAHLSNQVQFRVVLPAGANPAPNAVFAVHTTAPDDPWVILEADGHYCGSEGGWLYLSPLMCTALTPDGEWQIWCQLIYPEPPGGGQGDSITPGDPELDSAREGAQVESWTPPPAPPYGWPDGFPCTDNGNNDYYLGPFDLTAKNLTVTELEIGSGGQPPFLSPFVGVPAPPQGQQGSQVHYAGYVDDGNELTGEGPTSWELEDSLFLHLYPLGLGTDPGYAYGHFPLPDSFTGDWNAVAKGFYYVNLDVIEDEPADWTQYMSNVLSVGDLTRTGFTYTGPRAGRPTFQADVNDTRGNPHSIGDARYVWYHDDTATLTGGTATGPSASGQDLTIEPATRTFGLAGTYRLGATFRDTGPPPIYHQQEERWARPGYGTFDVPAAAHFWGYNFAGASDRCENGYAHVGAIVSTSPPATTFCSGRAPINERGGVVAYSTAQAEEHFEAALKEDYVIEYSGHSHMVYQQSPPKALWTGLELVQGTYLKGEDVLLWTARSLKAKLIYLQSCSTIGPVYEDPDTFFLWPLAEGVTNVGDAVAERCGSVVIGWKRLCYASAADALDEKLWPRIAEQDKGFGAAVAESLEALLNEHDAAWMREKHLYTSDNQPAVAVVGDAPSAHLGPTF